MIFLNVFYVPFSYWTLNDQVSQRGRMLNAKP